MKRNIFRYFRLTIIATFIFYSTDAQVLLNELDPNTGNQFIELYNGSGTSQSLSCYTLVVLKQRAAGTEGDFYVIDFNENQSIAAGGFLALNNTNWATLGSLKQYTFVSRTSSPVYSSTLIATNPANLLQEDQSKNAVFLFKGGVLVDLLFTKDNVSGAKTIVSAFSPLSVSSPCNASLLDIDFVKISNQLTTRNVVPSAGNGVYARVSDGACYGWTKRAPSSSPGLTNAPLRNSENNLILTAPSWSISSLTYLNAQGQPVSLLSNNTIPSGSQAFDNPANPSVATVNLTFGSFSADAQSLEVNVNVWIDFDLTGTISDQDILYGVQNVLIDQVSEGPIPVIIPFTQNRIFVEVSTTPGTCNFSTNRTVFTQAAALPAKIAKFKVDHLHSNLALSWSTTSESNNKGFEVQRSMGNTNDFRTIGFVETKAKQGNSESEISYSFEDADVKPGQTHHYRLNQIDFSGKSAFSPVKSIKPGSIESNLNVYPNPSQGSFTVNTGSASGKLNIFVMDNTGRVVNQFMNVSTTNTRISNLKKGFYTLKIVNTESGEQSAQRVVVQ
jgi:hypothetical protein